MCTDYNYWKNKYKTLWSSFATREEQVKTIIENETDFKVEYFGTGAGTTRFIDGKSDEKGSPDLHVIGTDIYIEVTGPLSDKVKEGSPLWVRPDKLNYVYKHMYDKNEFIINNFKSKAIWYVIHFDEETMSYAKKAKKEGTDYTKITPTIRDAKEAYIEISPNTRYVNNLQSIIDYLKSYKEKENDPPKNNSIRVLRNEMNMTQKEFAKYFEIPLATVQDWEHERRTPASYIPKLLRKVWKLENKSDN